MTLCRCLSCGKGYVAAPEYCRCGGQEFHTEASSGRGTIYSETTLYAAAEPFEKELPFQIAIIELAGGVRLTARIRGPKVQIGDTVSEVEERNGVYYFSAV